MEPVRKPFQGVLNIIRFNWHFYIIAIGIVSVLILIATNSNVLISSTLYVVCTAILVTLFISLVVSWYVYDVSDLYRFDWIENMDTQNPQKIVNINAGLDESSAFLKHKFKQADCTVLDFYDPLKHTEVSIKRARKAYPPYAGTKSIKTTTLPLADNSIDKVFAILSAHEIRNEEERILFFKELNRILKPDGQLVMMEHLRDITNFMAYTIGFLHFHSKSTWMRTFSSANFRVSNEIKITPFISTFILEKNGTTS
ncbi:hypothetical protein GCM10022393_39610 [Aquimarina addita]|uniref:Methyltransferase type 11 domain-containing protein n=1 Tax=Aquimarina addita TaxID=870485 RepID=A0ABP6USW7_9FLAO